MLDTSPRPARAHELQDNAKGWRRNCDPSRDAQTDIRVAQIDVRYGRIATNNGKIAGQAANFAGTSVEKISKENTRGEPNADLRSDKRPIGKILIAKKRRGI